MIRNSPGASTSFSMSAKERPRQVCAERRSKNGKQRSKRRRVTGHWAQYHPGGRQPKGTSLVRRIAAGRSIMIERQETVECGLVLLVRDKTPSRSVRLCARHGPEHGVQVVLDNGPPPSTPPCRQHACWNAGLPPPASPAPPQRGLIPPGLLRPRIRGVELFVQGLGKHCALTCRLDCSREAMGPVEAPSVYRGMSRCCGCVQQVTDGWTCEPEGRGSKAHVLSHNYRVSSVVSTGLLGCRAVWGSDEETEEAGQLDVKCAS